jgi:tRNA pseudouridine13 synthase
MKLKQQPDDFQVEELTDVTASERGPFALYRLTKRGWTTPDALALVRRRWKIEPRRLSHGGLKDRHAATVQFFTIFRGPRRSLQQQGVKVEYLGQVEEAFRPADIRANRFALTLRDLTEPALESALASLEAVRRQGVPNYFDDQRFGSVREGGPFIARLLIEERHEDALKEALAAPYEYDRAAQKREKAILHEHWGDWATCKERLPRGHARSLVDYLRQHPGDFRGAIARLKPELRTLYLSAYQSHLWNRMLARWLTDHCPPEQLLAVPTQRGSLPFHASLDEAVFAQLAALQLPLPSARLRGPDDDPGIALARAVLREEGLELEQMKLKKLPDLFFSRGDRAALCLPRDLAATPAADELKAGRRKLTLTFELPRGSYATLVAKRLTCSSEPRIADPLS